MKILIFSIALLFCQVAKCQRGDILDTSGRLLATTRDGVRLMPHGDLASRTIGYITQDPYSSRSGLEEAFDEHLTDGGDVVTTIDIDMQEIVAESLRNALQRHNAQHATAVVMHIATGDIKAIVNLGRDSNGNYRELYNYALAHAIAPSTFMLMSKIATPDGGELQPNDELTPLHILTFYNAVANDGKWIEPRLVTKLTQNGETVQTFETRVLSASIASDATIDKAKEMMVDEDKYYASFVGYFPDDNPKYSCIVSIYQQNENGHTGNTDAAYVFREIADKTMKR